MRYLLILLFLCGCNEGFKVPQKAAAVVPATLQEAKAAALLPPASGIGQPINIIAPHNMVIKRHDYHGEHVVNGPLILAPGATLWISADRPCTWDGVDFSDYVDATYTQHGLETVNIYVYPGGGG
jgi:hypothetical protein